ncbi:hypothetical protein [Hyalangium sp.]|uniref:hypothetical protein n=1 Tax=Hyalangium sp. TaxID=2028555 RepID=UPI002D2C6502|nr:hypothetical protein [Hyalangium sp.]HYH98536.1 hypothetical protein [Hyalangium sp.]
MLPLPASWKLGFLKQALVLVALVVVLTLVLAWGVTFSLTLRARLRLERQGDSLAFSLAALEARAFNDFAATNRTIAAAYVAMNHAHISGATVPTHADWAPVETLGQLMDSAHASQCAVFAVTLGAVRKGVARELYRLHDSPPPEPTWMEQTIGTVNAAEFSRTIEGMPCGVPGQAPETDCASRGSCFMRFRAAPDSGYGFSEPRVYSYVAARLQEGDRDEKAALFTARAGYPPQGLGQEPPNMFAPLWRARLPSAEGE